MRVLKPTIRRINVACGNVYFEGWENVDFVPIAGRVRKVDLTGDLQYQDAAFEFLYCSHFIEHLSFEMAHKFLKELYRISSSGAWVRIVTPDLENICREYIENRAKSNKDAAEFNILEIIDQSVRYRSGGKLAEFYLRVMKDRDIKMADYVRKRTGHECLERVDVPSTGSIFRNKMRVSNMASFISTCWSKLLLSMLPRAVKFQLVSFANVGERHLWLWDFQTLSEIGKDVGFRVAQRVKHDECNSGFWDKRLDCTSDGRPRKGENSLFIEFQK